MPDAERKRLEQRFDDLTQSWGTEALLDLLKQELSSIALQEIVDTLEKAEEQELDDESDEGSDDGT